MTESRKKATREYMKMSGEERFSFEVRLGVERLPVSESYEACINHIEKNKLEVTK